MSDAPKTPDTTPVGTSDPAILRMERRLAQLREMVQIGVTIARAPHPDGVTDDGRVATFTRVAREIRLTLALERRTEEALGALRDQVAIEQAQEAEERARAVRRAEAAASTERRVSSRGGVTLH